jgi:hypothetical protein
MAFLLFFPRKGRKPAFAVTSKHDDRTVTRRDQGKIHFAVAVKVIGCQSDDVLIDAKRRHNSKSALAISKKDGNFTRRSRRTSEVEKAIAIEIGCYQAMWIIAHGKRPHLPQHAATVALKQDDSVFPGACNGEVLMTIAIPIPGRDVMREPANLSLSGNAKSAVALAKQDGEHVFHFPSFSRRLAPEADL